jgi:hypothetical protein
VLSAAIRRFDQRILVQRRQPTVYHRRMKRTALLVAVLLIVLGPAAGARQAGLVPAPDRRPGEGLGPFPTLTIRNVMVIDGTGAPPFGPANIIVENNRIARIVNAGTPGVPSKEPAPPAAPNLIDGTGMYVMPGFVNLHAHPGDPRKAPQNEYVYKLYLAHGVTTLRGVELTAQPMAAKEKERSAANAIVAPRIYNYQRPGAGWANGLVDTPEKARDWVRWCAANGVDGMKLVAHPPAIMAALLDEAKKHGLGSTAHLEQRGVAQMDALTAAKLGLGTVTHFYGHFEPLMRDHRVQPWPDQTNYNDEQCRFGQVGRLWNLIHPHGAEALHEPKNQPLQFGIVRAGMLADMVLVDQNPIRNLKVLYGTGHFRLNDTTRRTEWVGGVRYTIKDGIVYDAKKLLADVCAMVAAQKTQRKPS